MALTRSFFTTSMLLLSLLVIASAGDYGYAPNPNLEKPKPEEKEKSIPRPDLYKPKPSGEEKEMLISKPDLEKPKPAGDYGYGSKPYLGKSKPEEKEKPLPIGIEGLVLCKSGAKFVPIKGAVARVTCVAVDEHGYETPFSTLCDATDAKGYFYAKLSKLNDKLQLTKCMAFLEKSPLATCKVPTNVNKGITGAPLDSYRILNDNKMRLYSVGPFCFTSEPKATPNGY